MMTGAAIVGVIASLGWLVLNYRSLDSHGLSSQTKLKMAIAWVVLIGGLAFVLSRMGV